MKLQNNVLVYEGVEIQNDVFLGPSCVFTNDLMSWARYAKGKEGYLHTVEEAPVLVRTQLTCAATESGSLQWWHGVLESG